MVFTVEYMFTFPHGKDIGVIISDLYEGNSISPCLAKRFSQHPKLESIYYYKDGHFVIQFDRGEYVDGGKCYLYESIYKGYPIILGKKWLDERNTTFDKTNNILRICGCGVYYHF